MGMGTGFLLGDLLGAGDRKSEGREGSEKEGSLVGRKDMAGWVLGWAGMAGMAGRQNCLLPAPYSTHHSTQHSTHTATHRNTQQNTSSLRHLGYGGGPQQGSSTAKVWRDGQSKGRRFGVKQGAV